MKAVHEVLLVPAIVGSLLAGYQAGKRSTAISWIHQFLIGIEQKQQLLKTATPSRSR